jgi:hypothetical protein
MLTSLRETPEVVRSTRSTMAELRVAKLVGDD